MYRKSAADTPLGEIKRWSRTENKSVLVLTPFYIMSFLSINRLIKSTNFNFNDITFNILQIEFLLWIIEINVTNIVHTYIQ